MEVSLLQLAIYTGLLSSQLKLNGTEKRPVNRAKTYILTVMIGRIIIMSASVSLPPITSPVSFVSLDKMFIPKRLSKIKHCGKKIEKKC